MSPEHVEREISLRAEPKRNRPSQNHRKPSRVADEFADAHSFTCPNTVEGRLAWYPSICARGVRRLAVCASLERS